uniref:NADH-ubiquinone oxidoreductase chain 4L n=1 Tax=Argulus americanus TaxID=260819 RepID=Q6SL29_9CRUS|nr:NADH dehydrogenase subunit 4L [Argulus americanus]AAS00844.1 NADH dehydrogenase subunit 4L [Argulus americanus]
MIFIYLMSLFIVILFSFCFKRNHLLIILLSMEFCMLILFVILETMLSMMNTDIYLGLYFLLLSICEGVIGLGLVVALSRAHGFDYFSIKNFMLC